MDCCLVENGYGIYAWGVSSHGSDCCGGYCESPVSGGVYCGPSMGGWTDPASGLACEAREEPYCLWRLGSGPAYEAREGPYDL